MAVQRVPPIPGVDDLFALLSFLKDEESYTKRIQEMEALRDELNARIAAAGTLEEIESLHIKARSDRQMAKETLESARAEAEGLVAEAEARSIAISKETTSEREALESDRKKFNLERAQKQKELEEFESVLNAQSADIQVTKDRAESRLREAEESKRHYDGLAKQIREVIGR